MTCHFVECPFLGFLLSPLSSGCISLHPQRILYNHGQKTKHTTCVCMKHAYINNPRIIILNLKFYSTFCIFENFGCPSMCDSVF